MGSGDTCIGQEKGELCYLPGDLVQEDRGSQGLAAQKRMDNSKPKAQQQLGSGRAPWPQVLWSTCHPDPAPRPAPRPAPTRRSSLPWLPTPGLSATLFLSEVLTLWPPTSACKDPSQDPGLLPPVPVNCGVRALQFRPLMSHVAHIPTCTSSSSPMSCWIPELARGSSHCSTGNTSQGLPPGKCSDLADHQTLQHRQYCSFSSNKMTQRRYSVFFMTKNDKNKIKF